MSELQSLRLQATAVAASIDARVRRLHDALEQLASLTRVRLALEPGEAAVDAWLAAEGFGLDPHGYFERPRVLDRARAGDPDPASAVFYCNDAQRRDPEIRRRLWAMGQIDAELKRLRDRVGGLAWVYYQDASGFAMSFPSHDPQQVVPPDFDWHGYFTWQSVEPGVNPERAIRWTPPNVDYGGQGLMIAASIPIYDGDALLGVYSVDLPLRHVHEDALVATHVPGQLNFITDREGFLLAHPSLENVIEPEKGAWAKEHVSALGGDLETLDLAALGDVGEHELVDGEGEARLVIHARVPTIDWIFFATFPMEAITEEIHRSMQTAFAKASAGDLQARLELDASGPLEQLIASYNEMLGALQRNAEARDRAVAELERSRSYNRSLFESAPVGMALLDPELRLLDVNGAFGRLVGRDPETLFRARADEVLPEPERLLGAEEEPVALSLPGGERTVRPSVALLDDGTRILVLEDITAVARLQEKLAQTQKMQAIGQLAGGVAHDFNNLLTAIIGSATFLHDDLEGQPEPLALLESIEVAADRAAALTGQLLAFSRRDVLAPQLLDVSEVMEEMRRLLGRLLDDSHRLSMRVEGELPAVKADRGQLSQVILNLVVNARDAMPSGGEIQLAARASEDRDAVALSVSDEGVGMTPEVQARLFEPFFTTKSHGTGLGLATVRDVVNACGGRIDVESALGAGTTLTVTLPGAGRAVPEAREPVEAIPVRGGETVLVVDDEALVRRAAARSLERAGYVVRQSHARDALEHIGRGDVNLLLVDVVMPDIGGRQLAEQARAVQPGLPVLFMSGYTDDTILRHGVETLAHQLIRKPFRPESLAAAVRRVLDAASSHAVAEPS
ncbi:MAG: ATP-binding protein [Myxococcota bacterium]|nr:ATP-binding protein [Myxococcota bacterium]